MGVTVSFIRVTILSLKEELTVLSAVWWLLVTAGRNFLLLYLNKN